MGAACELLSQLTPDLQTDPTVEGRVDPSALCAALQSAEVNLFADGVAQGTQQLAKAVGQLDKAAGRTRVVFQVAAGALQSRRSPHAEALGAQMARLAKASGALQQAAKDAARPIKGMNGSASQVKRVLDLVGALEQADEAAAELASDPDNLEAAGRLARASAEALAQAGVVAERLPPPLNAFFGPLFAGIPEVVDQVVILIEARDQRIQEEAGLGPMTGSVCDQDQGDNYAAPDAQRYCFDPAYKAWVDGGRIGAMP